MRLNLIDPPKRYRLRSIYSTATFYFTKKKKREHIFFELGGNIFYLRVCACLETSVLKWKLGPIPLVSFKSNT